MAAPLNRRPSATRQESRARGRLEEVDAIDAGGEPYPLLGPSSRDARGEVLTGSGRRRESRFPCPRDCPVSTARPPTCNSARARSDRRSRSIHLDPDSMRYESLTFVSANVARFSSTTSSLSTPNERPGPHWTCAALNWWCYPPARPGWGRWR